MSHLQRMIDAMDAEIEQLLARQVAEESDARRGGFWTQPFHVETRAVGFHMSELLWGYVTPQSRWHASAEVLCGIQAALAYLEAHQRPDGCFDLTPCNFASPPDTAFMLNAVLNGWWLLEKADVPRADELRAALCRLIDTSAAGIAAGGFHTPNHRWAIASCLLSCEKITGNAAYGARAAEYLREGLDINADGEFAERSAGNYNQVNDDQMIRLYLATGEERFLRAAEKNLEMMYCYFDPDGSVFTNNSTRQDMGKKVYADTYYILYLLVGYLLRREDFGAMAEWIWRDCERRGVCPPGVEWLLLFPEMDGYGAGAAFDRPFEHYSRVFEDSCIARVRRGSWSYTLLKGKPNCLYFQHGAFSLYMTIYANLCDRRNFIADTLTRTETGFRMTAHAAGWYYLPFPEKPETSDWWAMDNPNRRPKTEGLPLDITLNIDELPDGIDVRLSTQGIDRLPLRVELCFLPGGYVRTEHFVQRAEAGRDILVTDGMVEAVSGHDEPILVGPAFGEHFVMDRMGGAYPFSERHYTVYCTAYTPVEKRFQIRAARKPRQL